MPPEFIQLTRDCRYLEFSISNYLVTILSNGEHLSSPRVIEKYNEKILELFEESGRAKTNLVNSIADFIGSNEHKRFEETTNTKKELEVIKLEEKGHAYHLLPRLGYSRFSIREQTGLLLYKRAKDPSFSALDYIIKDGGLNREIMRREIDNSRIQWLNGKFYPENHNCWIFKDLPISLANRLGIDGKDVERVQKDFLPIASSCPLRTSSPVLAYS